MPPTVWPLEGNAAETLVERIEYSSDVLTARDGTEQRRSLREVPAGELEFSVLAMSPREGTLAAGLLQAHQGDEWAVPAWQFGQRLTSPVAAAATVIPCTTADLPWAWHPLIPRPYAVLWASPFAFELVQIASLTGSAITLVAPLAAAWPAGTVLVPARRARMGASEPQRHEARRITSARLRWTVEELPGTAGTPLPGPSLSMSTYLGLRVLDEDPNAEGAIEDQVNRRLVILDGRLGLRTTEVNDAAPAFVRTFVWTCFTRAQAATVRAFLDERRGRVVPFWMPSWVEDLELAEDGAAIDTTIRVLEVGYAARLWSNTGARRHLRLRSLDGTTIDRKVTAAVDNLDGTETLTLSSALGQAVTRDIWAVMFLRLSRLDDDAVVFEWTGRDVARVAVPVREVPTEAPL